MRSQMKQRLLVAATAVLMLGSAGCQLFVDLDRLDDQCPEGKKACGGECVPRTDPNTGCGRPTCAPCALPHAQASCRSFECFIDVGACIGDWENCDSNIENGCETDVAHDPRNCNRCFRECPQPRNGIAGCSMRECTIGGCNVGWEDCDHMVPSGCEQPIGTDTDCMTCNMACAEGTHCVQGGVCR